MRTIAVRSPSAWKDDRARSAPPPGSGIRISSKGRLAPVQNGSEAPMVWTCAFRNRRGARKSSSFTRAQLTRNDVSRERGRSVRRARLDVTHFKVTLAPPPMADSADLSSVAPMPTLRRFTVAPRLPRSLEHLREIAHNLWWAWEPLARELFDRIDSDLWEEVHGNPIELLSRVGQQRLDELAADDAFVSHLETVHERHRYYMSREGWFTKRFPETANARIAYFSMEYGLHQSPPIYSGGLGGLA